MDMFLNGELKDQLKKYYKDSKKVNKWKRKKKKRALKLDIKVVQTGYKSSSKGNRVEKQ